MNQQNQAPLSHDVTLHNRRAMNITGVQDIVSFDDKNIDLITSCGRMGIEGEELHIHTLDTEHGIVALEGQINGIYFDDAQNTGKEQPRGVLRRLFH